MAKDYNTGVRKDPAIEKWAYMRENTVQHFRLTPRTFTYAVFGLIVFPSFIYWGAKKYQDKFDRKLFLKSDDPWAPLRETKTVTEE